jgi:hypothetical protein
MSGSFLGRAIPATKPARVATAATAALVAPVEESSGSTAPEIVFFKRQVGSPKSPDPHGKDSMGEAHHGVKDCNSNINTQFWCMRTTPPNTSTLSTLFSASLPLVLAPRFEDQGIDVEVLKAGGNMKVRVSCTAFAWLVAEVAVEPCHRREGRGAEMTGTMGVPVFWGPG